MRISLEKAAFLVVIGALMLLATVQSGLASIVDEPGPYAFTLTDNGYTAKTGYKVTMTSDADLINLTMEAGWSGITAAYVLDSSRSVLATTTTLNGNTFTFSPAYSMSNGVTYYVVVDNGGSSYDLRRKNTGVSYPQSGTLLDWIAGAYQSGGVGVDSSSEALVVESLTFDDGAAPPSGINTHTVQVTDLFDDSDLSGVTVTVTGGSSNTTDASGIANFYNLSGKLDYNASKSLYFSVSGAVESNATSYANMTRGVFNVTSIEELITGDVLGAGIGVWTVNTSGGKTYDECSGTYPCMIYLADGENQLTLQYSGAGDYFDRSFQVNVSAPESQAGAVTGVYDAVLSVTAIDYWTNASINTFSLNVSNATHGYMEELNTSSGVVSVPAVQGVGFFLFIDAPGYVYANATVVPGNTSPEHEFVLYTTNSVTIYFWDEFTGSPITNNVTVEFDGPNSTYEVVGSGGYLYEDLLDPGTWTLTMSADGYDERIYYITVTTRSHQVLNAYLLNSTLSQDTTFYIKDADGNNLPNATVTMQDEVNGTWTTIAQKTTDFFGIAYFPLLYAHAYRAIIEAPDYITKAAEFERVLTTYTIRLTSNNTQGYTTYGDEFTYVLSPSEVRPELTNFTLSVSSPLGKLEWFSVTTLLNGSSSTNNNTGSPSGGTAQVSLNLTTYQSYYIEVWYRVRSTGIAEPMVQYRRFLIYEQVPGNYSLVAFADHYSEELEDEPDEGKAWKTVWVVVAVVLVATTLSMLAWEVGAVGAAVVFIVGGAVGWMSLSYVIVVAGALVLGAFLGGKR